jgi:hypothetical protein
MKKYLLVAILAAAFATPALTAQSWWLGYNGKKCEIFADKRGGDWNMLGAYPSRQDAEKAKHHSATPRRWLRSALPKTGRSPLVKL